VNRKVYFLAVVFAFILTGIALAQASQQWVQQHSGMWASGVVMDSNGNAYVTGPSLQDQQHNFEEDVVTIKYDPAGNELWVREFDETSDSTNGSDVSSWITLDPSGNVIVSGKSFLQGEGERFLILKYDPSGNLLWRARSTMGEVAIRVKTDAAGNIYTIGHTLGTKDFVTAKFDPSGNQLWLKTYNGPNDFNDEASSLDVTPIGTVVVTGRSTGGVTSYDFATIVYETDGSTRWIQRYNSPGNGSDQPLDVAFGPNEVVYVGGFESTADYTDFSLVKYGNDGTLLWNRTYNGSPDKSDSIKRIQLDSAGNIIVTGYEQQSNFYSDVATIKYDANGNQLWIQHLNLVASGDEMPWSMVMGPSDAVYVAGESGGKFALVKYSAAGAEEWNVTYDNPGNLFDRVQGVAAGSNRIVVTGLSPILTVSYTEGNANQPPVAVLSADTLSGTAPLTVNFSSAGSFDPDGNIVSYQWDFGDQTTSNQANPTHIFTTAGSYTVVLTVVDNDGSSAQDSAVVIVTDDTTLFFDDFASGDISAWQKLRGNWSVVNQELIGQGARNAEILSPFAGCGNCSVEADLQLKAENANASILGWYVDKKTYVEVMLMGEKGKVVLKQRIAGNVVVKSKARVPLSSGVYHVKSAFDGTAFSIYLNGNLLFTAPAAASPFGNFGFRLKGFSAANALVTFDNMLIQ
jgi:PKD repeat protein